MNRFAKYTIISLWSLFVLGLLAAWFIFYQINKGNIGYMPPLEQLENPKSKYATIIYSADSVELGRFSQAKENRVFTNYNDLSPHLINALIATEDARFHEHSGIDMKALFRAMFKTILMGQKQAGGGSTITQQLAKQLYTVDPASSLLERAMQKPIEWVIAVNLEHIYTKEEIINMYLNKFDFCYNAVGIQSAARIYFDKLPADLNIEQAAMLVGMLQNPSMYNPIRRPEKTAARRAIVLGQMVKAGYLTQAEADSLNELPLLPQTEKDGRYKLAHSADHKSGLAPYLREYLRKIMRAQKPARKNYASWQDQQYHDDSLAWENNPLYGWCNKHKKPNGEPYNLTTDGLRIYTTIDSRMQRYAEEAMTEHLCETLQPEFFKEKQNQANAPYNRKMTADEVNAALTRAMRQSERYRGMKEKGLSQEEIEKAFHTPVEMKVFGWQKGYTDNHGIQYKSTAIEIDTIMTPWDSLRWHKSYLRAGFMCMDVDGFVKAYVGGPDFNFFQYDMITTGRRQVGSTIKPFLYTMAMEEGRTPCDEELNVQPVLYDELGRPWSPRDGGKERIGEMVTLRWGLMKSNNWISARVMSRMSPASFVQTLHNNFGITAKLDPVYSLCLGVCDLSVSEMVTGYSTFPGQGLRSTPIYVTSICDNTGVVVADFIVDPTLQVKDDEISGSFSYDTYLKMLPMLRDVIDHGTGGRIRSTYKVSAPMGGKTGTTNDNSDGWFMAFTPSLIAGTWVGGEERSICFDRMAMGQGASMALPIYAKFIKKVYADPNLPYKENEQFEYPSGYDPCSTESYAEPDMIPSADSSIFE